MIPQVGGFQGCYLDDTVIIGAVRALCENTSTHNRGLIKAWDPGLINVPYMIAARIRGRRGPGSLSTELGTPLLETRRA